MTGDLVGAPAIPTWDLAADLAQLLAYPFMRHALLAATLVALVAGVVGPFVVLRGQAFVGHVLANVGFAGAAGGALFGLPAAVGMVGGTVAASLGLGALGGARARRTRDENIAVASVQTCCLGLGLLFERLYAHYAAAIYALLFGSVLTIDDREVVLIGCTAGLTLAALAVIARPLAFVSLDPVVAAARGIPVRGLEAAFLVLLALGVAEAVQVVGVLLVFSLLVTPAAIAWRVVPRPGAAVAIAVALALLFTWLGLAVAYYSAVPVGFVVSSAAVGTYLAVRLLGGLRRRRTSRAADRGREMATGRAGRDAPAAE